MSLLGWEKERGGIYSRSLWRCAYGNGESSGHNGKGRETGMNRSEMLHLDSKDYEADMDFFSANSQGQHQDPYRHCRGSPRYETPSAANRSSRRNS